MKRLREEARESKRLIDATQGRRTRSIIITDSNHVILSAIQAETISQRLATDLIKACSEVSSEENAEEKGSRKKKEKAA